MAFNPENLVFYLFYFTVAILLLTVVVLFQSGDRNRSNSGKRHQ